MIFYNDCITIHPLLIFHSFSVFNFRISFHWNHSVAQVAVFIESYDLGGLCQGAPLSTLPLCWSQQCGLVSSPALHALSSCSGHWVFSHGLLTCTAPAIDSLFRIKSRTKTYQSSSMSGELRVSVSSLYHFSAHRVSHMPSLSKSAFPVKINL